MITKRILVVDDEPAVTRSLKLNLESGGIYDVFAVNDASNALTAARTFRPDLILLDVMMPGIDGGDLSARLRADPLLRNTTIVFLTALVSNKETDGHEMLRGQNTFLAKPVDIGELKKTIEEHIRHEEGVALAATQGTNHNVYSKQADIQTLKQQNDSLVQRLSEMEATVKRLVAQK
jgi:CheY-like chemotaxis protein